jgi:hypothetical protein
MVVCGPTFDQDRRERHGGASVARWPSRAQSGRGDFDRCWARGHAAGGRSKRDIFVAARTGGPTTPSPDCASTRPTSTSAPAPGAWTVTDFTARHLNVAADGVVADALFTDVDGRVIEIHIDGEDVAVVRVPGSWLHRRHIIKYSAPLCTAEVGWRPDGPVGPCPPEAIAQPTSDGWRVTGLAERDGHRARLHLAPGLPDLGSLGEGRQVHGRWATFDDARLTGGAWCSHRVGDVARLGLDVDERWRPGWLLSSTSSLVRDG